MTCTHRGYPNDGDGYSEALSYDRLPEPWRGWAKLARSFTLQLDDHQDREDLLHDIIVRLAEVAEVYRQQGEAFDQMGVHKGSPVYPSPFLLPEEKVEESV